METMEKISVSDLSVGDWVEIDGRPKRISSVLETPMGGMVRCQEQSITAFVEHISPIPLTPEILEKNGFTHDKWSKKIWRYEDEESEVIYYIENGVLEIITDDCKINMVCKSVADLQRVLRLAKVGKEIEL